MLLSDEYYRNYYCNYYRQDVVAARAASEERDSTFSYTQLYAFITVIVFVAVSGGFAAWAESAHPNYTQAMAFIITMLV